MQPENPATWLWLEQGVTRCFGTGDIGTAGLVQGWAAPEPAHNWNDGPQASLLLAVPRPAAACQLVLEGVPLSVAGHTRQDVTCYVNGLRLGFWRLTSPHLVQLAVRLETAHFAAAAGNECVLRVDMHVPDSLRLSSLQTEGDHRELGFCFRTLALLPA